MKNARAYSRILGGNTGTTLTPLLVLKLQDESGGGDDRQKRVFRERNLSGGRIHAGSMIVADVLPIQNVEYFEVQRQLAA